MKLVLLLQDIDRLSNGQPGRLVLDHHGAIIGRSPHVDWSLPDPQAHISSRHCEIDYRDGGYVLVDTSTNGTFVNGSAERLKGPHRLQMGDSIAIGAYKVRIELRGDGRPVAPPAPAAGASGGWGWDDAPIPVAAITPAPAANNAQAPAQPPPASGDAWGVDSFIPQQDRWPDASPSVSSTSGWPSPASAPFPASSRGHDAQPPAASRSAGPLDIAWSPAEPLHDTGAGRADDVWAAFSESNSVDWARGGFSAASTAGASGSPIWGSATPPKAATPAALASEPAPPAAPDVAGALDILLKASGLASTDIQRPPEDALAVAGAALVRLVGGLVVMLEARARAKAQLGAQGTMLEFDGNNPLKFARSPERALAQPLGPRLKGYMSAEQAVEDAFKDLQAHQTATLMAMQGALRTTLNRFSPAEIRKRAESRGLLSKILPAAREAELWRAYEREFEGVVRGSDEAFMDVFTKAFKEAYEKATRR